MQESRATKNEVGAVVRPNFAFQAGRGCCLLHLLAPCMRLREPLHKGVVPETSPFDGAAELLGDQLHRFVAQRLEKG